jgi:hypothetical protein
MHKTFSSQFSVIVALFATPLLFAQPAVAQQRQALATHAAAPEGTRAIGRLPLSRQLKLSISLPLRNQDQLDALLQQLYDPASPNYRHFLTVEQFTEQFSPTLVDYQRVIGFAQSAGLQVTHTFANRLVVDVKGPVGAIEQAFQVRMYLYQHPTEKRTFYAPNVEPTVEQGMPILSVDGLSTFSLPHPMLKKAQPNAAVHGNTTGSGAGGQFLGSDMRAAYAGGTSLDGSGQTVGLIELGPYRLGDVFSYFSSLSQPLNVPLVNVLIGVDGICGAGCDDGEEAIDIQQAIAMAPNLSGLIVYEAYNGTQALSAYAQAASDNIAKQLSISFGWGGTPGSESGYEQVFKELAVQGQSSFVASGDAGGNSGGGGYPGNSPNITDAGGTDLTTASAGGAWSAETGWNGSGGGWNSSSPIPNGSSGGFLWDQTTAINSTNGGSPNYRNIPDVSAEANTDNYFCANGSCQGGIGGTSLAAPRWAAFVALINQQAVTNATPAGTNPTLGLLNPTIYPIGLGQNSNATYSSVFHDIISGSNPSDSNPPLTCTIGTLGCLDVNGQGLQGFNAETGFDLVAGWGSPNGPTVFSALFPPTTNANFTLAATNSPMQLTPGGSGTSSISVTPLHGFNAATNLSVVIPGTGTPSYVPTGLSASLSANSIPAGGGPVTLTVQTTSTTPGGTYVIAVVGTSGSLTQTGYVTVELPAFVGLSAAPAAGVSVNQGSTATAMITATTINGFNSAIRLTVAGLPTGVTASFTPVNSTTTTMTLTAAANAALTGAGKPTPVTITGTATGSAMQSTVLNVFVNPANSGGAGTQVNLSSNYNVFGFFNDANESSITATNSLDGVGYAYSVNLLGTGLDFKGTQFNFGPANQADAVANPGTPITLPSGYYTSLELLATGIEGNQAAQAVTVTYTDSTTSNFTQSFSDWCSALNGNGCLSTGGNSGESVAVAMPYRDSAGGPDNRVFYLYHYSFALNTNKQVQSLTLPSNRNVVVLAATLSGPLPTGFSLAASPNPVSLAQGGKSTTTVTVISTGGFTGTVGLSASGLPSGVTALFNPTGTNTTSTLSLTANSSATTGPATIIVTGTSGTLTQTTNLNLTVTAPAGYSLAAGPPSQGTVNPGGSSQATVTIASTNGYTGSVTLSCSIAPVLTPAPSCSFGNTSPVNVTANGGSATLTFTTVGPSAMTARPEVCFGILLPIPALALLGGFRLRSRSRKKFLGLLLLWLIVATLMIVPACGGGSGSGGSGGGSSDTPAGTYTITLTGKDANGTTQANAAPTITITVN